MQTFINNSLSDFRKSMYYQGHSGGNTLNKFSRYANFISEKAQNQHTKTKIWAPNQHKFVEFWITHVII